MKEPLWKRVARPPVRQRACSEVDVASVACGNDHSLALVGGKVYRPGHQGVRTGMTLLCGVGSGSSCMYLLRCYVWPSGRCGASGRAAPSALLVALVANRTLRLQLKSRSLNHTTTLRRTASSKTSCRPSEAQVLLPSVCGGPVQGLVST